MEGLRRFWVDMGCPYEAGLEGEGGKGGGVEKNTHLNIFSCVFEFLFFCFPPPSPRPPKGTPPKASLLHHYSLPKAGMLA